MPNALYEVAKPGAIDRSRPILNNPDGTFSTENTITIEIDGKYHLIPTIVGGRQLSGDEAILSLMKGENKPVGTFNSQSEASAYAKERSAEIGRVRGPEAQKQGGFQEVFLQDRNELLQFPADMPDDEIQRIIDRDIYGKSSMASNVGGVLERAGKEALQGVGDVAAAGAGFAREAQRQMPERERRAQVLVEQENALMNARARMLGQPTPEPAVPADMPERRAGILRQETESWGQAANALTQFAEGLPKTPAPVYGENQKVQRFIEDAVTGLARFLPAMGITAVAPTAGLPATYAQIFGNSYRDKKDRGVDDERAFDAAQLESLFSTPAEFGGNLFQLRLFKKSFDAFSKSAKLSEKAAEVLKNIVFGAAGEGLEEYVQQYPQTLANIYADNPKASASEIASKAIDEYSTMKFQKEAGYSAAVGAAGGAILGGAGAGLGAARKGIAGRAEETEPPPAAAPPADPIADMTQAVISDVAEGRVTADELREARGNIPDTDPRAQAIDRFFAQQPPAPPPSRGEAPARQAEVTPQVVRRTPGERQRMIEMQTGGPTEVPESPPMTEQRRRELRQRDIDNLWDSYEQRVGDGEIESKRDLVDQIRADAQAADLRIPNPEIKKLADRVWNMARKTERNPEIERTRQLVEGIPQRAAEARTLQWEEVLRTSPVNIEGVSPYAGSTGKGTEAAGQPEGADRGAAEPVRLRGTAPERMAPGAREERLAPAGEQARPVEEERPAAVEGRPRNWFELGRIVAQEYTNQDKTGKTTVLKPSNAFIGKTADALGIGAVDVRRALAVYNSENPRQEADRFKDYSVPEIGAKAAKPATTAEALADLPLAELDKLPPEQRVKAMFPEMSDADAKAAAGDLQAKVEQEKARVQAQQKAKEPWEINFVEFGKQKKSNPHWDEKITETEYLTRTQKTHESIVRKAVAEGKPVPPSVLKDYPDLQPKTAATETKGWTNYALAEDTPVIQGKAGAVSDTELSKLKDVYAAAKKKHGYSSVPIADVADAMGWGQRETAEKIASLNREGVTATSAGDWSTASQREKNAGFRFGNREIDRPQVLVKIRDEAEWERAGGKKETEPQPKEKAPDWAQPDTSKTVNGETFWQGRLGLGKGKWAHETLTGGYRDTIEDAAASYRKQSEQQKEARAHGEAVDAAAERVKSGDYTDADIKTLTGMGMLASTGRAEGILRTMGMRATDARGIVKHSREVDTTSGGAILFDVKDVVERARRKGFLPSNAKSDEKPAKPTPKLPKPKPESKVTTLRGAIHKMGGLRIGNMKGEFKELPTGAKFLLKKTGEPLDLAEQRLKEEGWLREDESLAMVLRDPLNMRRGKVAGEGVEKREQDKTEQERNVEREMAREPEAPPEGDYITLDAEDLPEGKKLTIIDDSAEGWDVYEVTEKDPFGVTLKDGRTVELRPGQQVQVRKEDLPAKENAEEAKREPVEEPEKPALTLQGERQMAKGMAEMRTRGKKQKGEQGGLEFGKEKAPAALALEAEKVSPTEAAGAKEVMRRLEEKPAEKKAESGPTLSGVVKNKPATPKPASNRVSFATELVSNASDRTALLNIVDDLLQIESKPQAAIDSSEAVEGKATPSKGGLNSVLADTKFLRDIIGRDAFLKHGFSGLDVETQRLVLSHMLSLSKNSEVLKSVVEFIPVDVVDNLRRKELSADGVFNNVAVLKDALSENLGLGVPRGRNVSDSLIRALTLAGAEVGSGSVISDLVGPPQKSLAATGASNRDLHRDDDTRYDRMGQQESGVVVGIASPNDIPMGLAVSAHAGTSWSPESRGAYEQKEYARVVNQVHSDLMELAKTEEQKEIAMAEAAQFKANYLAKYKNVLASRSRVMSAFIAGPSKFPARTNEKRSGAYEKRLNDFIEWERRAIKKMRRKVAEANPNYVSPTISSDNANAVELLEKKIAEAERLQGLMKEANKVVRDKKLTDEQKISEMVSVGLRETTARKALGKDFAGRVGFPDYLLKNNNANIRRMKERIEEISKVREAKGGEYKFEGGKIVDNAEENRVQIIYDTKPDAEVRTKLKANGFKWARSQGAWQRQRNNRAYFYVKEMTGVDIRPERNASLSAESEISLSKGRPYRGARPGLAKDTVDRFLQPIAGRWMNGPAVKVVQHQHELPDNILAYMRRIGAENDIIRGTFFREKVYLVADNFTDIPDAFRTLSHETFAHYGLKRMLGNDWLPVMEQIYRSKEAEVKQVAAEYNRGEKKIFDLATEKGKSRAAEEWLAREAELNPTSSIVERVVAAIRRWLRRLGLDLKMSDGEIKDLLARSREYVQAGRPANVFKLFSNQRGEIVLSDGEAAFAKKDQGLGAVWYSQMERVLSQKLPGKGNPKAIAGVLESWAKKGEFKQEELEWSGILDWLKENPAATITKSDVLDWLAVNNVRVQEVVKSKTGVTKTEDQANADLLDYTDLLYEKYPDAQTIDDLERTISPYEKRRLKELQNALETAMGVAEESASTVYDQYQLPGGENYRELLLTLPSKGEKIGIPSDGLRPKVDVGANDFRSTHYQEPNILAHVRFNERTDADGRKVLFIEEVQSDWHQSGRKRGYVDTSKRMKIAKELEKYGVAATGDTSIDTLRKAGVPGELQDRWFNEYIQGGMIPNAPFKTSWPMLAMKRMVRYASENGFDAVAWTTGEQQAERYDLGKQVDSINAQKTVDGIYSIQAMKDGQILVDRNDLRENQLAELVGKDLAEKIVAMEVKKYEDFAEKEFTGLDLKVGGEGMKGFYDKILPAEVNKFFGKAAWGNARVGEAVINSKGVDYQVLDETGHSAGVFNSREAALEQIRSIEKDTGEKLRIVEHPTGKSGATVHSLPITDAMREKAMGGMPLFAKERAKTYLDRLNEIAETKQVKADLTEPPDTRKMFHNVRGWARQRFGKGFVDRDMKRLNKVLETPYGLAKKYPAMKKALDVELSAAERRSEMLTHDYNASGLATVQESIGKNKAHQRELSGLINRFDGKRMPRKAVPTDPIKWPDANDMATEPVIQPAHYDEARAYLQKLGVTPEVADAFITIRQMLDKKLIEIDQTMRTEDLDPDMITEYRSEINQIHNYFPHRRTGNAYVQILDTAKIGTDDAVKYRAHYYHQLDRLAPMGKKARDKAEAWLRNAIAKGDLSGKIEDYEIKQGAVKQLPDEVFFQVPVEGMQQIADVAGQELEKSRVEYEADRLLKKGEVASMAEGIALAQKRLRADMSRALSKAIAEVFKGRGWARHAIPRKGIPGHDSSDTFGVLFDYLSGFAGFKTKIERARAHAGILHSINAKARPEEYRYVSNYIRDMLANQDAVDRAVDTVRGLFFLKYLGFVLKSGVVNLTQNVIMAAPRLGIETAHANAKLARAMYDVRKALASKAAVQGKEVEFQNLSANERRMLHEMTEKGISIDQFLRELKGQIPGKNVYSQAIRKFADKSGIFMQLAERFNRASTALAAYRVGVGEKNMTHDEATEFAKGIVYDSHFVYGKHNLPMWARGGQVRKYLRSAYTFRAFAHNYLNMLHHMMMHQGAAGKIAVARSIRNTVAVGGLASMPFFQALSNAVMWAMGDDDKDAMTAIRESLPDWMRDTVTYGLPGAAGVDISGSLSLDMPREWYEVLGVPYAAYQDTLNMVESWKAGQTMRAVAESPITPMMVRNAMRGIEMYAYGQHTRSGRPINAPGEVGPRKIDEVDLMKKIALGFQPVEISKGYAQHRALDKALDKVNATRKSLSDRFVNAMIRNDTEGQNRVITEVVAWNERMVSEGKPHMLIDLKQGIVSRLRQPIQTVPKSMRGNALRMTEAWQ